MTATISVACPDTAGTTVCDDGTVTAAFHAAIERAGLNPGTPGHDRAQELGGGGVGELAVVGDAASDAESGLRAGAGLVAGV